MLGYLAQPLHRERSSLLPQLDVPCYVQSMGSLSFLNGDRWGGGKMRAVGREWEEEEETVDGMQNKGKKC